MRGIFLDTAPLIYLTEGEEWRAEPIRRQLIRWLESDATVVTSVLTLMEVLAHPRRMRNGSLEDQYRRLLSSLLGAPLITIDERIAVRAADYRVQFGFKAPDALQLAAAVAYGCEVFYTNDERLRKFPHLDIMLAQGRP